MVGTIIGLAAETGVSTMLKEATKVAVPNTGKIAKFTIAVATWAMASLIGGATKEYVDDTVRDVKRIMSGHELNVEYEVKKGDEA